MAKEEKKEMTKEAKDPGKNAKDSNRGQVVKEVVTADGKKIKVAKTAKKTSLGLKKKYNDIEDLKNDLVELNKHGVDIVQADVINALDRFDMSDEDLDQFYEWLSSVNVDLIDESEDEEDLEDDDYLASEDDDDDSRRHIDQRYAVCVDLQNGGDRRKRDRDDQRDRDARFDLFPESKDRPLLHNNDQKRHNVRNNIIRRTMIDVLFVEIVIKSRKLRNNQHDRADEKQDVRKDQLNGNARQFSITDINIGQIARNEKRDQQRQKED